MTTMPSTAESMIDRQRSSLVRRAVSARFCAVMSRAIADAAIDLPGGISYRRDRQRDIDEATVFRAPHGVVMFDTLPRGDPLEKAGSSSCFPSGINTAIERPMISCAV